MTMTVAELDAKIAELESAAANLGYTQQTEIDSLKMQRAGAALDDIAAKLDGMTLPDIEDLDAKIAAAKDAQANQQAAIAAFNTALGIVKGLIL